MEIAIIKSKDCFQNVFLFFRSNRVSRTTSVDSDRSEDRSADGGSETPSSPPKDDHNEESNDSKSFMKSPGTLDVSKTTTSAAAESFLENPQTPGTPSGEAGGGSGGGGSSAKDDGLIDPNFDHNAFSVFYNMVLGYTDATGRRLALPFLRLPNKR